LWGGGGGLTNDHLKSPSSKRGREKKGKFHLRYGWVAGGVNLNTLLPRFKGPTFFGEKKGKTHHPGVKTGERLFKCLGWRLQGECTGRWLSTKGVSIFYEKKG